MGDLSDQAMERRKTHTQLCNPPTTTVSSPLAPRRPSSASNRQEEGTEAQLFCVELCVAAGGKDGRSTGKQHSSYLSVVLDVDNLGLGQLRGRVWIDSPDKPFAATKNRWVYAVFLSHCFFLWASVGCCLRRQQSRRKVGVAILIF